MPHMIDLMLSEAEKLDRTDPFKPQTELFDMPVDADGKALIYLNGNSLGVKPKQTEKFIIQECHDWGKQGVRAHFDKATPWFPYHECVTESLARLVGAKKEEVVAMGTLTANLHATLISFYRPTPERFKLIRLGNAFPSDVYAIVSQVQQRIDAIMQWTGNAPFKAHDAILEVKPKEGKDCLDFDDFEKVLETHGKSTDVILIEGIHYKTGQYFDIERITKLAHEHGCKVGVNLAHVIGNVFPKLHDWNVDFAVWCSYKYLSAGPGSIAGLYVHEKHLNNKELPLLAGWWGHNKQTRFLMPDTFDPIPTAERWQVSNPGIFQLAALRAALEIFDKTDLILLREKNIRLSEYLQMLLQKLVPTEVQIVTPLNPAEHGCQLSLRLRTNRTDIKIEQYLYDRGIVCDARGDLMRVAPNGLYNTFSDIFHFIKNVSDFSLGFNA